MRVALATSGYGDPWDEQQVLVRRLGGALACSADVDVLVASGAASGASWDGACRVLRFPATPTDLTRRWAWRRALLGKGDETEALTCSCDIGTARWSRSLPDVAEEQLVLSEGGHSPELYEHLRATDYAITFFVGYHSPVTWWGMRALPESRRMMLAPGTCQDASLWLRGHEEIFARAERLLVCTETERAWIGQRLGPGGEARVENLGFVVGVSRPGAATPADPGQRSLVMARDWCGVTDADRWRVLAARLEASHPNLRLLLVGPGSDGLPSGVAHAGSRTEVWRWMSGTLAVLDPAPHRLIGLTVLESMLLGVPVVVDAHGRATREHAETGNGGLWYRTDDELVAAVGVLFDEDLRRTLGRQGRAYAEARFTDTDAYIKRIAELLR